MTNEIVRVCVCVYIFFFFASDLQYPVYLLHSGTSLFRPALVQGLCGLMWLEAGALVSPALGVQVRDDLSRSFRRELTQHRAVGDTLKEVPPEGASWVCPGSPSAL